MLESLGDDNSGELRKKQFDKVDADSDGWISYDEFLSVSNKLFSALFILHLILSYLKLVYNMNPPDEEGNLKGLAKLCYDVAENIKFVSSLSVGEQLEYGLF